MDPTLVSIADLEPGCVAYRTAVGEAWKTWEDDEM
jgi:hypothetical protein